MAASVQVNVNVNDGAALAQLNNLDSIINKLNGKGITINVNTAGQVVSSLNSIQNGVVGVTGATATAQTAVNDYGKLVKTVAKTVDGEWKQTTDTYTSGVGKMASVTTKSSGQVTQTITNDFAKQQNASEKAAEKFANTAKRIAAVGTAMAAAFVTKKVADALGTMREVDAELANIRKVTGESSEAIAELGNRAYETASKYGVSAEEYLKGAADFAKAGYDNYGALAELAIKTQLVGDVSAETASKFLLSADAAYEYGGNITKLSTVLDRANVIENNYATSIEKIAEGMPIVASTASMANMSIDELMASLGTITAVTQETGRKAATALRALIMNITGEVGAVLEDEQGTFEVTQESVNSMTDALKKYGSEAIKAAIASGDVINPLEAIRSLAQAYQNGDLSRNELFGILTDIGGKLRTNQLAALVENFGMFEEMLGRVQSSSGSADQEVGVMLDTWNAKVAQLDNKWTEFVSHMADTSAVKGAIDTLTSLIDGVDDALVRLGQNQYERAGRKESEAEQSYEEQFGEGSANRIEIDTLRAHYAELNEFERKRLSYLEAQEEAMRGQVNEAANLTKSEKVKYLNQTIYGEMQYEDGLPVGQESFTLAYQKLQEFNNDFNEAVIEDGSKNRQQIATDLQRTLDEYSNFYGLIKELQEEGIDPGKDANEFVKAYESALERSKTAAQEAIEESERFEPVVFKAKAEVTLEGSDLQDGLDGKFSEEELKKEVTVTIKDADNVEQLASEIGELPGEKNVVITEDGAINASVEVGNLQSVIDLLDDKDVIVTSTVSGQEEAASLKGIIDSINSKTVSITAVFTTIGKVPSHFAEGTKNAPSGIALVNEKGPELISDNGKAYIANGGKPAIVSLSKGAVVLTSEETKNAIGNAQLNNSINAYASGKGQKISFNSNEKVAVAGTKSTGKGKVAIFSDGDYSGSGGGGGGGGNEESDSGSSSGSHVEERDPWKDLEDELKDALNDYNDIAEWYHNQKKHDQEAKIYNDAIVKINEARDKYLSAGFKEDSAEVARLANKIFDYQEEIREAHQHAIDDLEEELDNLDDQIELAENQGNLSKALELEREAQKKVAELLQRYREAGYADTSEEVLKLANKGYDYASDSDSRMKDLWSDLIDALEAMRDTQDDANELAEKQLAVDEARDALQKAQNQRTVRVFNPVTGQWEWVADSKNLADAQENLKNAEEALAKEQQSQELAALKKLSENGGNLSDFTLGPGLSALISGANAEDMNAFASALGLLSGGIATTSDTSSRSIFDSVDSHNNVTQYTFNGVTIDAGTAQNTTLADLVAMISPLAITTNMPA